MEKDSLEWRAIDFNSPLTFEVVKSLVDYIPTQIPQIRAVIQGNFERTRSSEGEEKEETVLRNLFIYRMPIGLISFEFRKNLDESDSYVYEGMTFQSIVGYSLEEHDQGTIGLLEEVRTATNSYLAKRAEQEHEACSQL